MKSRSLLLESAFVTGFAVLGVLLRAWHLDQEAVEHFDEGIYASVLWHDATLGTPYPAREFYAPPLLSGLIEVFHWLPGIGRYAPFLPSVVLGSLTTLAMWWLGRAWFGRAAGIFLAAVLAMSDFHIIYSRMALTDVPCLFWIIVSVYLGTLAVHRQSIRIGVAAGFVCGVAWWTKYTGWLPLAIVLSGTGLWWIWQGRKSARLFSTAAVLLAMIGSAAGTIAPWLWQLQDAGGYSAVTANHRTFLYGWSDWTRNLAVHLKSQFWQDGVAGPLSLCLGLIAAGFYRWNAARSSTGNFSAAATGTQFPSLRLLARFIAAGIALSVLAFRVQTPLLLTCVALGGIAGMFLWPVLRRSWTRRELRDMSPLSEGSLSLSPGDLESAPTIDPALGLCTTLTWFIGMLLATPLYHPYARLFFPLLASIWLAAAGGVSWWLESNISVQRRSSSNQGMPVRSSWGQQLVSSMLMAAIASSLLKFDENNEIRRVTAEDFAGSSLFLDRTGIVSAASSIADLAVRSARGGMSPPVDALPAGGLMVYPEVVAQASGIRSVDERPKLTIEDRQRERLVVYAYGEPALLLHLNQAGVSAMPVSHLRLRGPGNSQPEIPTFIVFGPNAKRTHTFWEQWMQQTQYTESIGDVHYSPSQVTLFDLFSLEWLRHHPESAVQTLELHRIH